MRPHQLLVSVEIHGVEQLNQGPHELQTKQPRQNELHRQAQNRYRGTHHLGRAHELIDAQVGQHDVHELGQRNLVAKLDKVAPDGANLHSRVT